MNSNYFKIVLFGLFFIVSVNLWGQTRKDYLRLITAGEVSTENTVSETDTIPVEIVDGWIVLKVQIGDSTKNYIWDTGTSYSTTRDTESGFSRLEAQDVAFNDIVGNSINSELYKLTAMSLGKFSFHNVTFMFLDTKAVANGALSRFDGLLGLNVIDKVNWKFNFDDGFVVISKTPFEVEKDKTVRYANYIDHNSFLTRIKLRSGKMLKLNVLIDFGVTNSSLYLSKSYMKEFEDNKTEVFTGVGIGVGGAGETEKLYVISDPFECIYGPKGKEMTIHTKITIGSENERNVVGSTFFTKYNFVRNSTNSTFTFYDRQASQP